MGLFSKLFGGGSKGKVVSGKNPGATWIAANKFNKARGGYAGGYGALTFRNIMNAHGDAEMIVDEHGLNTEECGHIHPSFGMNCYNKAWLEEYQRAQAEANMENALLEAMGLPGEIEPEDLMDYEQIEEDAYEYACELAAMYINGDTWIPGDIINWAYYDVSDHNY